MPENQAGPGFVLNAEKIELLAELAVVAALGFFEPVQIFVQLFLIHEAGAVNPLHLRIAFLPFPVGARHVHQLERLNAPGGGNVRPAAEIQEFPGGIKRDQRLAGFLFHQLAFEFLIALAVKLERLGFGNQFALVRNILGRELVHLRFDFRQVFRSERLFAHEFVEESVISGRTNAQLHLGEKLQHRRGQQMRGGMAEHLHRFGIFRGEYGNFRVVFERARKIDQLAIRARHQRFLGQARRNLACDFRRGGSAGNFAGRAVGQRNLNSLHAGSRLLRETSSLLARAEAVKAGTRARNGARNFGKFNRRALYAPAAEARGKSLITTSSSRISGNPCDKAIPRASA